MPFYNASNDNPLDPLLPIALIGADDSPGDFAIDRALPAVEGAMTGYVKSLADGVTTDMPDDPEAFAHATGADAPMRPLAGFGKTRYTTKRYSEGFLLPDDVAVDTRDWRNSSDPSAIAARAAAINRFALEAGVSVGRLKRGREMRGNVIFGTKANWHASSLTLLAGNRWSQPGSTPAKNIQAAADATRGESCIMSWARWLDLQTNESFLSALGLQQDSSALTVGDLMLKFSRFGIENVIIGRAERSSGGGANKTAILDGWTWIGCLGLESVPGSDGSARMRVRSNLVDVQTEGSNSEITVSRLAAIRIVHRELANNGVGELSVPIPDDPEALDGFRVVGQYQASKLSNYMMLTHRETIMITRADSGFLIEEA